MKASIIGLIAASMLLIGCSSTNLNSFRTEWTGGWVKASPFDTNTPGKIELGMGYGSLTIFPMARGQGAKVTAITYELLSGHPLFCEEITIYPMGQDAMLKLEKEPQSIFKIPFLIDIKETATPLTPTKIEIVPVR
jgi:hypothetical protein